MRRSAIQNVIISLLDYKQNILLINFILEFFWSNIVRIHTHRTTLQLAAQIYTFESKQNEIIKLLI